MSMDGASVVQVHSTVRQSPTIHVYGRRCIVIRDEYGAKMLHCPSQSSFHNFKEGTFESESRLFRLFKAKRALIQCVMAFSCFSTSSVPNILSPLHTSGLLSLSGNSILNCMMAFAGMSGASSRRRSYSCRHMLTNS